MSFAEIYNEQLFDLLLSTEAFPPPRNQQQRRFNIYGGNGSESALDGKRFTPFSSVQKPTMEVPVSGGDSGLYTPPAMASTPQHAEELAIYERADGSTYIKASRALKYSFLGAGGEGGGGAWHEFLMYAQHDKTHGSEYGVHMVKDISC